MRNLITYFQLFVVLIFLTSCKTIKDEEPIKNNSQINNEKNYSSANKLEIKVSCADGDISEFLKEGWKVVEEFTEEKVCTWKSYPSNKKCDI